MRECGGIPGPAKKLHFLRETAKLRFTPISGIATNAGVEPSATRQAGAWEQIQVGTKTNWVFPRNRVSHVQFNAGRESLAIAIQRQAT